MPFIFVYGSLKQGFANEHVNTGRRLPGQYRTQGSIYLLGPGEVPCLVLPPGPGHSYTRAAPGPRCARLATWVSARADNRPQPEETQMRDSFRKLSDATARWVGSYWAFIISTGVVVLWAVTGPIFHYSDTWQLVMNTTSSIITFLMVFLIQNTQNRDSTATQLKLDELLRAVEGARTEMVDLESLSDEELERLHGQFAKLRERMHSGTPGGSSPSA